MPIGYRLITQLYSELPQRDPAIMSSGHSCLKLWIPQVNLLGLIADLIGSLKPPYFLSSVTSWHTAIDILGKQKWHPKTQAETNVCMRKQVYGQIQIVSLAYGWRNVVERHYDWLCAMHPGTYKRSQYKSTSSFSSHVRFSTHWGMYCFNRLPSTLIGHLCTIGGTFPFRENENRSKSWL